MESDLLFQKYTVDEIREIEKKTRQDIERKKEELRQMVGERYRDLIEAADTITDMKNSSQRVTLTISRMQELCQHMKTSVQPMLFAKKPLLKDRRSEEQSHYSVATQIKVLLDMPEKIWSALDTSHHLQATSFFLLARHINTSLQLDAKQSAAVLRLFPVLTRQWAAISHFRSTILQTCREKLKMADVSDQVACECLCSVLLLEDSTPRQVFNEFLLARSSAVQEQLKSDSSRVKDQVCEVIRILTATLHQIYALFYSRQNSCEGVTSNLLMKSLTGATDKNADNTVLKSLHDVSLATKYLPDNVKEYRPSPRYEAKPIEVGTLQSNSQEWIEACRKTVNTGVTRLLGFVSSVKGLAAIRNQIWELLQQDEKMQTWDVVCEKTLNRKLSLWEEFLQPLFSDRAKVILQGQFDGTLDSCKQQVARVMADVGNFADRSMNHERDLSSYVWTESLNDLPSNTAWVPLSTRTLTDSGALVMKARAYTPAVQSLCKSVDSKLKILLEDSNHYTGKHSDDLETGHGDYEDSQEAGPFEKYADRETIFNFLETSCEQCVSRLLHHLKQQLYACKQQLENSRDVVGNKTIIDRILLLARFISALSELSTYLQQCVVCHTDSKEQDRRTKKTIKGHGKVAENPRWSELKSQLTSFCLEAYSAWIGHTAGVMLGLFEAGLSDNRGQAVLHSLTKWDEVEIEEETEEGKTVKSVIKVPMQPSWYVQALLYNVCEEINRIGGHALHRSTLTTLAEKISDGIAELYTQFLQDTEQEQQTQESDKPKTPFSQSRALQLWFDVRFLGQIFPRKDDSKESQKYQKKMQKAQEAIESHIDPFDFDVFTPYMYCHLGRQNQRCQVLYGALTSLDRHTTYMGSSKCTSAGQQEQHNVLPLTYTQNRFQLLPLSMSQPKTGPTVVEPPKPKNIPRHSVCLGELHKPPLPTTATHRKQSLLDTMSTMWFNKA